MSKNIREIYEDRENLLKRFNNRLKPSISKKFGISNREFSYFDGSEIGHPVVVDDDLTNKWLELNYLFSTGFRPNKRAGVGEIGADIKCGREINGQKYLTVHIGLLDGVVRALNDFRGVEEVYSEWLENQERYEESISRLYKEVETLSRQNPQLEDFKKMFGKITSNINWQHIEFPSEDFVSGLEKLSASLKGLYEDKTSQEASRLNQELGRYSSAIPQLKKIREYHKRVPYISRDGMIRIDSPVASGGLCMHTHPGYDDSYNALPSQPDLIIIAAQSGAIPIMHIGGGETQGEHYIMHIPRKFFFEEVKQIVDKKGVSDETGIIQIKQDVLSRRLDDIMDNEILGFKIDGKNEKRVAVLSPIITSREYEKHIDYLESRDLEGQPFEVKDIILGAGTDYFLYVDKFKDFLAQKIGRFSERN